ncbi:MAG: cytochrome c oxidase accessory protein CcoG [Cryomorphaceae bacterium]|nr:cytochrome c oxidase accessory protein CcoG [Cryomorphaceae bacterium]
MKEEDEEASFRDSISTVDKQGKRVWVYPKRPSGKFYNWRKWVSYTLLALLIAAPFIKIGGEPLLLLNIIERKFVILGRVFWPQDTHLFLMAMITMVVFIIVFTVVYGRIFCGWVCPQTIFMELVFRRIEYWIEGDHTYQRKLNNGPWNAEKIRKKLLKHAIFLILSFFIANIFLAYIIGSEALFAIITDPPAEHVGGLVGMVIFSLIFYGVFAQLREQVCTTICPYGRLQGVLLDRDSIVIAYDKVRGEGRSKFRKGEDRLAVGKGDCIDCNACVVVCPTGIDIRNGTQLECVNCTACIDACDSIMDSVGYPKGLIRYASENNIVNQEKKFKWTTRVKAYTVVLGVLMVVLTGLIIIRSEVETSILRTPGMTYQDEGNGLYSNLYNYKVVNKTNRAFPIRFESLSDFATIQVINDSSFVEKQGILEGVMFIHINEKDLKETKTEIEIAVYEGDKLIETVETNFMGPFKTKK